MKVQEIDTRQGRRWILLDSEYRPVPEVNQFLQFLDHTKRSENTLRTYAMNLKLYGEFLELRNESILSIANDPKKRPLDILADFLVWLQYPDIPDSTNVSIMRSAPVRSAKTVNQIIGTVLSLYDYLGKNKLAEPLDAYREAVSMDRFKPFLYEMVRKRHVIQVSLFHIQEDKKPLEYITPDLYTKMLGACRLYRDKALIGIMYEGGLRLGEVLGLRTQDIQVWDNRIQIVARDNPSNHCHVKNKAEGNVYVSNTVMETISHYYARERAPYGSEYAFVNLHGPNVGMPMQPGTVEKLFSRVGNILGTRVHPHMCRHGCATARLEAGWDDISIQRQLRHASLSSTRIYEHYSDELLLQKTRDLMISSQKRFGWELEDDTE